MKVLFAVSTEDIAEKIIKDYQRDYKEIISSKNVYYFNAIIKELQRNQTYDRIVISEDLEPFTNNNYDAIDKFIFEKLDGISDEAIDSTGRDIPIVVICSERREKADNLLIKLFSIGVYDALIGNDRTIENVCHLLNKPRTKKEAKTYYRIEQGEYEQENEKNVSEVEIQNILSHYRRLGKNEERYVESFNSIAEQYNDDQLKIIIKFLPMDVKAVLEAQSTKYQSIMTYSPDTVKREETKKNNLNVSKIVDTHSRQPIGPVIIPSAMRKSNEVRKITNTNQASIVTEPIENDADEIAEQIDKIENMTPLEPINTMEREIPLEPIDTIEQVKPIEPISSVEPQIEQPVKRGRGRPRKVVVEPQDTTPKRGRGRPRKNPLPEIQNEAYPSGEDTIKPLVEENSQEISSMLPGFEQIEPAKLPEIEDIEPAKLPELEEIEPARLPEIEDVEPSTLPDIEDDFEPVESPRMENTGTGSLPGFENQTFQQTMQNDVSNINNVQPMNNIGASSFNKPIETQEKSKEVDISYLLTQDKKIVSFVGTSKNGVSFLVNNIADILSNNGIKTAIVDLTMNKNSYYIYTENREELREIAYASMENLKRGEPIGIEVNKNLTVFTSSPNIRNTDYSIENMLTTLVKNFSLILLDCDYSTNKEYFRVAQEIYMVQSMDVLTIQPLTEFLRRLKLNNILQPEKLRAVINKAQRVRGLNEEMVVGGMSTYNDPEMSIQDRLFDMKTIIKTVVPFDIDAYSIYLSGIANCEISTRGYNKVFMTCLNKLADQVYPVISGGTLKKKHNNGNYMSYQQNNTTFSNNMNTTLDQMKRQYK